jgi:hypothetical protein
MLLRIWLNDREIVIWRLICTVLVRKSQKPTRQYHKADYDGMRMWLSQIYWHREFEIVAVDGKLGEIL